MSNRMIPVWTRVWRTLLVAILAFSPAMVAPVAARSWDDGTGNWSVATNWNPDGVPIAGDYIVWRKSLGQTGAALAADGNGDQVINQLDYNVWRSHFGQTAGSGAVADTNSAVPEPATCALLAAVVVHLLARGRRNVRAMTVPKTICQPQS